MPLSEGQFHGWWDWALVWLFYVPNMVWVEIYLLGKAKLANLKKRAEKSLEKKQVKSTKELREYTSFYFAFHIFYFLSLLFLLYFLVASTFAISNAITKSKFLRDHGLMKLDNVTYADVFDDFGRSPSLLPKEKMHPFILQRIQAGPIIQ